MHTSQVDIQVANFLLLRQELGHFLDDDHIFVHRSLWVFEYGLSVRFLVGLIHLLR